MSKPSLRQSILTRSVSRLLDEDEELHAAVMLSTRHRWFLPYAILSGVVVGIIAAVSGLNGPLDWLVAGLIGGALAGMSTTNYSVLAQTDQGLVLCRSSRVRQYAKAILKRLPADAEVTMVGSTVISSDWQVDGVIYSTTKRWEAALRQLSMGS